MNTVIFQDEITLYWEKQWELPDGIEYQAKLDGKIVEKTVKTHFSFLDLQPNTEYLISIERLNENGDVAEVLYQATLRTLKAKRRIDVTKSPYNAVGDGKTLNTAAIQNALDDCTENDCVYLPQGMFLTGALNMHSDSELYLEQGAMLKGSDKAEDYLPKVKSRFEGTERMCYRSLINIGELDHKAGYTTRNITIRGAGTIFGGGLPLANEIINAEKERLAKDLEESQEHIKNCENENRVPGRARGKLIGINNCENVLISGLTLGFSASWNVHFVYSKNVVTYGCKIWSEDWKSEDGTLQMERVNNGDGWDPDSSEDCVIFNTCFYARDDAVAIKSGKNPEGNLINRPTKNIRIFDCVGYYYGIAIGSEVSGGISDIKIWDCNFFNCKMGLTVKTTQKRGGYIKDITVRNCQLASLLVRSDYTSNDDGIGAEKCTVVENLAFENITVKGTYPYLDRSDTYYYTIYLYGLEGEEHYFNNLRFKNVQLYGREDGNIQSMKIKNVKNLSLENIRYMELRK
ncbi:MAG: glycoside hydrolase family 28 protein [Clostridia bacterium]|nr:glycoside hydrolase family 28 protein [Clostridia bacterium]